MPGTLNLPLSDALPQPQCALPAPVRHPSPGAPFQPQCTISKPNSEWLQSRHLMPPGISQQFTQVTTAGVTLLREL